MKAKKLLSNLNITRIIIVTLSPSLFVFFNNIFNGIINTKYFWFYFSAGLLFGLVICKIAINRMKLCIKLDIVDLLIFVFLFYSTIRYYNIENIALFNSHSSLLFVLVAYFFVLKYILLPYRKNAIQIGFAFVKCLLLVSILQSIIAILQLYGIINTFKSSSIMSGTMVNIALFAMLLSVIYPISLYYYLFYKENKSKKSIHYLSALSLIFILSVIPFTQNRISWISISLSTLLIFIYTYRTRIKPIYSSVMSKKTVFYSLLFLICVITVTVTIYLFEFKEGSSLGRLFIWKVSLLNIKEYFLTGVGFGGFEYCYNQWQGEYFMNNPNDIANSQLADYVSFAYNEFLHVFIETGIIGLSIFIAIFYFVFRNVMIRIKNDNKNAFLFTIPFSISFFSFVIMSLTSYPFQNIHLLIILFSIIAMLSYGMPPIIKTRCFCKTSVTVTILIIVGLFSFSRFIYVKPYIEWKKADILYHKEYYLQSICAYSNIADLISKDALFLQYYAKSLQMAGEYNKSISVLTESMKKRTDQQAYICLASNYIGLQMYKEAEVNLLFASYLIPNKIYPTYLLAKTFNEAGDKEKAKMYATICLNIPIKVRSPATIEMRNDLNNLIEQINDNEKKSK